MVEPVSPWMPKLIPEVPIPYNKKNYEKIKLALTSRQEELTDKNDPSLMPLINSYNDQIAIAEIVDKLHSDFDGKIQTIANGWWRIKLENAPENAPLYFGSKLSPYIFHFRDYIGRNTLSKDKQMENISKKLLSLLLQFNEAYDIAFEIKDLDAVVKSSGGGCFEGQVEGIYEGASKAKAHYESVQGAVEYFVQPLSAIIAKSSELQQKWTKSDVNFSDMYAEEFYSSLKPMLENVRLGDEKASSSFFDVQNEEDVLAVLEQTGFLRIPSKQLEDINKNWLSADSEVLVPLKEISTENLRRLRVLDQKKYEGGKESCGYHSIKNAFGMILALSEGKNPAGFVLDESEFNRVYQYFKSHTANNKEFLNEDLLVTEAIDFLNSIESPNSKNDTFQDYSQAYQSLKSKQDIEPISIFPMALDSSEDTYYNSQLARSSDIIALYQIAKNPEKTLSHTMLVADSALGAGHWFTLSLFQENNQQQWVSMDSEGNRIARSERAVNMLNQIFDNPDLFLKNAFNEKFVEEFKNRGKYIDKATDEISLEDKAFLLTKSTEESLFKLTAEAVQLIEAGKFVHPSRIGQFEETILNMEALMNFYATNVVSNADREKWKALNADYQNVKNTIGADQNIQPLADVRKRKREVKIEEPSSIQKTLFNNLYKKISADWIDERGENAEKALFDKTLETFNPASHLKLKEAHIAWLKIDKLGEKALLDDPTLNEPKVSPPHKHAKLQTKIKEGELKKEESAVKKKRPSPVIAKKTMHSSSNQNLSIKEANSTPKSSVSRLRAKFEENPAVSSPKKPGPPKR